MYERIDTVVYAINLPRCRRFMFFCDPSQARKGTKQQTVTGAQSLRFTPRPGWSHERLIDKASTRAVPNCYDCGVHCAQSTGNRARLYIAWRHDHTEVFSSKLLKIEQSYNWWYWSEVHITNARCAAWDLGTSSRPDVIVHVKWGRKEDLDTGCIHKHTPCKFDHLINNIISPKLR